MISPLPARLVSSYDNIQLAEAWTKGCVEYLQNTYPLLSQDQLYKHFQDQFLFSDLSRSCTKGCLPTRLASISEKTKSHKLKGRCLFQVLSITDISNSAFSLIEIHDQIKEEQELSENRTSRDTATATIPLLDLEEAKPKYSRGLLKILLSDGLTNVWAVERQGIPDLHMFDTPLGIKIVVTNPDIQRGIIIISSQNTLVLKSQVDEFDVERDHVIEKTLKARLDVAKASSKQGSSKTNTTTTSRTRASASSTTNNARVSSTTENNNSSALPAPTSQVLDPDSVSQVNELHLSDLDWNDNTITSPTGSPLDDSFLILDDD